MGERWKCTDGHFYSLTNIWKEAAVKCWVQFFLLSKIICFNIRIQLLGSQNFCKVQKSGRVELFKVMELVTGPEVDCSASQQLLCHIKTKQMFNNLQFAKVSCVLFGYLSQEERETWHFFHHAALSSKNRIPSLFLSISSHVELVFRAFIKHSAIIIQLTG